MTAPAATTPAAPAPPAISPIPAVDALTTRLIAQHGTVENALRHLVITSVTTDQQLATLTHERDGLRARLPEGAIVLTKEAAANWQKLQALNLTPEQIEAAVKKLPTVETELSKRDADKAARAAAIAAGLDPDGFSDHVQRHGLVIEMRDGTVKQNGKDVAAKIPFVRSGADEKAPFVAASEYVGKLAAHEQRALKTTPTAPTTTGAPYPVQHQTPASGAPTGNPLDDYIARRNAPKPQPAAAVAS